jgi:hypothetical protein
VSAVHGLRCSMHRGPLSLVAIPGSGGRWCVPGVVAAMDLLKLARGIVPGGSGYGSVAVVVAVVDL